MSKPLVPVLTAELRWLEDLPSSVEFSDIYFSHENGLAEKQYVFIEGNHLLSRWQDHPQDYFCIAEIGFGTGLNFLLTWSNWLHNAPENARLYYYSCEKFPLKREDLHRCLKLWPQLDALSEQLLQQYPVLTPGFHHLTFAKGRITLILMLGEAIDCYRELLLSGDRHIEPTLRTTFIDAWYLDGFSPKKNAALWQPDLLDVIALLSKPGTTLATYTVANTVKTNLQMAGFTIQKRKGFADKRSMLMATFVEAMRSDKPRHTPWHVSCKQQRNTTKKALIVGGGLAGCFTAYALAKRGWQITLLEQEKTIAQGASGNRQAVLYPQFSAFSSPLTVFMLHAYLYALRVYPLLIKEGAGELKGIFQLAFNQKEQRNQMNLQQWLSYYPELAQRMSADEGSQLCGIPLHQEGLFIPTAGWLDIQRLCNTLVDHPNIDIHCNQLVDKLGYEEKHWQVNDFHAKTLILANGFKACDYPQTKAIPMKSIGGQLSFIAANEQSQALKIPLCANGHILPKREACHATGATYHLDVKDITAQPADDLTNFSRLKNMATSVDWSSDILDHWCGIRAATPDYLPVVGAIPDATAFNLEFARLADNAKRWLPYAGSYLPGLFICAGFGSRGLTMAPLCAEILAGMINGEPNILAQSMIKSLSPARFLVKHIIRSGNHN